MGCCFTKPARHNPHPHRHHNHNLHHNTPTQEPSISIAIADRAPPPTLEQEYVKEVLSETPLPNIHPAAIVNDEKTPLAAGEEKAEGKEEVEKVSLPSEVLEMSEMCSASESYSTEKRDEEVVARSPVKAPRKRPHSGGRERFAKSPATRAQQSRNNAGVPGESSGRSPLTRGSMGRSPMKKPGGRLEHAGVAAQSQKQNKEEEDPPQQQGNNESIDNPHVSMECFIFL